MAQRYTAPVRRGFGHIHHLFAMATNLPNSPLASYLRDLSPHQQADVQAATDYLYEQFQAEAAKYQIPAHLLLPQTAPTPKPEPSPQPANTDNSDPF
jgi:hypothetical protein